MPCGDFSMPYSYDDSALRSRISELTRICCDLAKNVNKADLSPESAAWVSAHEREDIARMRAENAKAAKQQTLQQALGKLSEEEMRALMDHWMGK